MPTLKIHIVLSAKKSHTKVIKVLLRSSTFTLRKYGATLISLYFCCFCCIKIDCLKYEVSPFISSVDHYYGAGNDILHSLISSRRQRLRVDLEDFENFTLYAEYDDFAVGPASTKYNLTSLGDYSGDAGQCLYLRSSPLPATLRKDRLTDYVDGGIVRKYVRRQPEILGC